jgi:hypothetical protein
MVLAQEWVPMDSMDLKNGVVFVFNYPSLGIYYDIFDLEPFPLRPSISVLF